MGDLYKLINDSELWELLFRLGDERKLRVQPEETKKPALLFEINNADEPVVDLTVWPNFDSVPCGIYYRMHVHTPNGTMYETNADTIKGKKLKQSLNEIVDYYGGKN